jgi:hypothetical protein
MEVKSEVRCVRMTEEDIDPGDHHTREMYARYGLAMYFAQVVEAGIKNALVMAELADARFAAVEDFVDRSRRRGASMRDGARSHLQARCL